jgi:outer membrane protein
MKQLITYALGAMMAAGTLGTASAQQTKQKVEFQLKAPHAGAAQGAYRSVAIDAAPPCTLAREIMEQLGRLAPQVKPLPNDASFAAANGELKVVVACGMSADETYTYQRLLTNLGVKLLSFNGDEPPQMVVQELAWTLKLPYKGDPSAHLPLSYVFPDQGVRLTIQAAEVAPVAAAKKPPPAKQSAENLWDLYLLAKSNDPDLGRSQSRFLASKADWDVARAGLHPRVSAGFGMSWIDQTVYNYAPSQQNQSVFGYNYNVLASVPVLHFPTYYNIASAAATERSEEAGVVAARQNLIFKLGQAYFGVLKARADQQIARDEISRVKQAMEQAQAFLKAGTGDIIAVYEAQARLDSVIADLNRSESTLSLAEQRLASVVGKRVVDIGDLLRKQPLAPDPSNLDWWLATMEERDPQIRQAKEGLAGTAQQTKAARAEHLPVIDANGGYDVSRGANFLPSVETHQWRVGATITVPLYSGGETSARVRRATANEAERRYALDQVREQRRENIKQSFFNLTYNVSLIKALEQKEASSLVQLNAIKKGRTIGTRTAIDLLNAEQAYSMAQRDLKNALYDNVVRVLELKAAGGVLSEQDLVM